MDVVGLDKVMLSNSVICMICKKEKVLGIIARNFPDTPVCGKCIKMFQKHPVLIKLLQHGFGYGKE